MTDQYVILDDGRVFGYSPIISIKKIILEPYTFEIILNDREIKATPDHKWLVWDKSDKKIKLLKTKKIYVDRHYIIKEKR